MSQNIPPTGLAFVKWEGLGNDFVVLQGLPPDAATCAEWARQICHRHTGVGADGLAFLTKSPGLGMVIYNADGSLAQMCGNALRCLGAVAVQTGRLQLKQESLFQTASGPRAVTVRGDQPWWVEVDMGQPELAGSATFSFEGQELTVQLASMGNPHAVLLAPPLPPDRWEECGRLMQRASFAEADGINVEFVTPGDPLQVWVYERGVGPTLACGTGACAAFVVAQRAGLTEKQGRVALPGGLLEIEWSGTVRMRGPAREVFRGHWTAN